MSNALRERERDERERFRRKRERFFSVGLEFLDGKHHAIFSSYFDNLDTFYARDLTAYRYSGDD